MKKIVLATTALVSVAYAGSALAQESMVMGPQGADASLGGFYEFGYRSYTDDSDEDANGADSESYGDTEIFISFSRTTDNGLTFGMDVELESATSFGDVTPDKDSGDVAIPGNSDEASLYIQGDFGEIRLGENDRASDSFQTWAPTHAGTYGQDDGNKGPRFVSGALTTDDPATDDDDESKPPSAEVKTFAGNPSYEDSSKIIYFTPDFSGFRFGVSWADSGDSGEEADISLGASYSADLGDMDLTLNVAASDNGEDGTNEESSIAYGVAVSWHDLSLTLSHAKFEVGENTGAETTGFGIGYQINDKLSVGGYFANADHDLLDQSADIVSLSAGYTIAPGLSATLAWNQFDLSGVGRSNEKIDNEGQEAIFEVEVSF